MKILIADDNSLFREALKSVISHTFSDAKISSAESFAAGMELLSNNNTFDMIILDFDMPEMSSEHSLNSIMSASDKAKIVIVSSTEDSAKIRKLFTLGIRGYISKRSNSKIIGIALLLIANGGKYIPDAVLENFAVVTTGGNPVNYQNENVINIKPLTNRQAQVLDLVAQGKSNKQIAYDMGVSEATVKLHINALLRTLHVTNRTQAVVTAQKIGLI